MLQQWCDDMTNSYIEWFNENEGRGYPFYEKTTRVDDLGVRMPDSIVVDLSIVAPTTYLSIRVSSVTLTPNLICIGISNGAVGILVGTFIRANVVPYTAVQLTAVVAGVSGWVTFGSSYADMNLIQAHSFATLGQGAVEERVVHRVDPPEVVRFLRYGGRPNVAVSGDVKFTGNENVKIIQDATDPNTMTISIDPEAATKLVSPCGRSASKDNCGTPPIRTIAGVGPDEDGKITLEFV